jgi:hypothetical protein
MYGGSETLLDCTDRAFHLANMAIGSNDVHFYGTDLVAYAFKFTVGVYVADGETPGVVEIDDVGNLLRSSLVCAVRDRFNGSVADATRNCVDETNALHEKEIDA